MLHTLLPAAPDERRARDNPAKYVDQGVPLLIESLVELGAQRGRLIARLCGGAQMLSAPDLEAISGSNGRFAVGRLNVRAAEAALRAAGLHIQGRSTGGHAGRTVKLYLVDGQVTVRTLTHGEQVLK
jgi:chemotaxis protein CheD